MTLDLSKYLINESENAPQLNENEYSKEPINLSKYIAPESETAFQSFKRHVSRAGARAAETIAGFPGDLVKFTEFLSEKLPKPSGFLEREPNLLQKKGKEFLQKLPTSEELKDFSSYLTSGFTDPQSAQEKLGDEITSLSTSLLIPSKNPTKFKSLLKAIGQASAAKGAGKGVEELGGSPTAKMATELGTLFLTGLIGKKTANQFVSEQFKEARSKIPENTMLNTQNLTQELENLSKDLSKGIGTPTKREVLSAVDELKSKASGGAFPADELVESYHNLNERINSKKLFDELNSSERKLLKHRYDLFKDKLNSEIKKYGKDNPEFYDQWKKANQAYATIAKSQKVSNFLESNIGKLPKHLAGTLAIELFLGYPRVAAGTLGGAGAIKTGELLYRIANSPKLREHYINVIKESSNENLPAVIKNLNAINKELNRHKDKSEKVQSDSHL